MAHEFRPKTGKPPLPIDELTRRLKTGFRHVDLDVERASQELQGWIEWATEARARGATAYTDERIDRARRSIGRSVFVTLADAPKPDIAYLTFTLEPDEEKIFIGYESDEQEQATMQLRERLAQVLDYDMEEV